MELGTFTAASLFGSGGALELNSFDVADGTILGVSSAGVHEHPFAIVGGRAATPAGPGGTSRSSRRGSTDKAHQRSGG